MTHGSQDHAPKPSVSITFNREEFVEKLQEKTVKLHAGLKRVHKNTDEYARIKRRIAMLDEMIKEFSE